MIGHLIPVEKQAYLIILSMQQSTKACSLAHSSCNLYPFSKYLLFWLINPDLSFEAGALRNIEKLNVEMYSYSQFENFT